MRTLIVGLGIQGKKRREVAGSDSVGTVDSHVPDAQFSHIEQVPLDSYDAALVCTPDDSKIELLNYLLSHKKHCLVEKPLLSGTAEELLQLKRLAEQHRLACYTAYNHRFEPHIERMKSLIQSGKLGELYTVSLFYGNGTARDVRSSPWRDKGRGVLTDIGSHLLDTLLFIFGEKRSDLFSTRLDTFENKAYDYVAFGSRGSKLPKISCEATLLSWRNTFRMDVIAERGSAHIDCLCKWGPSTFTLRTRVLPSGRPSEEPIVLEQKDPTWQSEYEHFKQLCKNGQNNIQNDIWIAETLQSLATLGSEL